MKKTFLILFAILASTLATFAQVGIGSVPEDSSILDLTNSNDKYLILPVTTVDPSSVLKHKASVIYYDDNLYMKTPGGIKVFTPWKWDGDSTHVITSPVSATVGIGFVPTVTNFKFQVANAGAVLAGSSGNAAIMIGNPSADHLLFDNNEIMAKTNPVTAGTLKLQEEGGVVEIRGASSGGSSNVLIANGSVNSTGKLRESGNDLLPVGSIIMWSGTTAPAGWALCDGGTYTLIAGGTVITPDLRGRFVVSTGQNQSPDAREANNPNYSLGAGSGMNQYSLIEAELPSHLHNMNHVHTLSDPGHGHQFPLGDSGNSCSIADDTGGPICMTNTTSVGTGIWVDNFTGSTGTTGSTVAHENRPPYYALAFIMKL